MSTLPPGHPPDPEPDYRIGLGMLLGIAALAAAAAVLAVLLITRHHHHNAAGTTVAPTAPATTRPNGAVILPVPNLVGQHATPAGAGLRRAGFHVTLVRAHSTQPRGTVVKQDPAAGTKVAKGSDVRLSVSTGAAPPLAATTTQEQATTPATTTAPTATETTPTTPAQPATAQVPSLSGEVQTAVQRLGQEGFHASVAYVPGSQPLGTVVAQSPSAGATAPRGSQVTVNVSAGPNAHTQETVPNVVGKSIPEALSALHAAGLRLIELKTPISDQSRAGLIVQQTPLPGERAPKNAQVLVYWGAYQR
jgi:eukaryotic-like serine/threonine-protein kinase